MTTSEKIKVMQAWLNGQKIRYRVEGGIWAILNDAPLEPCWNWDVVEYSLVPEPREIWVNLRPHSGYGPVYRTKASALAACPSAECIHFREVI